MAASSFGRNIWILILNIIILNGLKKGSFVFTVGRESGTYGLWILILNIMVLYCLKLGDSSDEHGADEYGREQTSEQLIIIIMGI